MSGGGAGQPSTPSAQLPEVSSGAPSAPSSRSPASGDLRGACPACGAAVILGARKCKACRRWIGTPRAAGEAAPISTRPRGNIAPRATVIVGSAAMLVVAILVTARESPVGEAPPLTSLEPNGRDAPAQGATADEAADEAPAEKPPAEVVHWNTKEFRVDDAHPLDIAFSSSGRTLYVSADDATLREYHVPTGELLHKASVPATGDRIQVLGGGRWVSVVRHADAARIPIMDTTRWDKDPRLFDVGQGPADVVELPDGTVVCATTESRRLSRFDLPTGARLADITLPHPTGQLFLVRSEGRPYLAALGASLAKGGRPSATAWIDLFDPNERPFGATRRSISVGRDPRRGAVSQDGTRMLFPDRSANVATLFFVAKETESRQFPVGQKPEAAFLLAGDRYGVTLDVGSGTATVLDLEKGGVLGSLSLGGTPLAGRVSADRRTLFVSLGGTDVPPRGRGLVTIGGDPPRVLQHVKTGMGASSIAVSPEGRAAVASYWDRTVTLLEP